VLCDLRGEPQTEVAARLGVPVGTIYSRLAKARKLLADRLRKLGVALSAGGLCLVFAGSGRAAIPAGLTSKAIAAALSPNSLSAAVAALSHGVLRTMYFRKTLIVPVLGLVTSLGLASGLLPAADPTVPTLAPASAAAEAARTAPAPRAVAAVADTKLEEAPPVVVKTVPECGADGVDPGLTEIKVTFSKTMTDKSWSWASTQYGESPLPQNVAKIAYDKDGRTCTATVKLEPGTTYAIWLNSEKYQNFKDADGRPAVPYLLVFRTKAK
jgi:RNA polymerase sigma-70 factor (ECF subfamily)